MNKVPLYCDGGFGLLRTPCWECTLGERTNWG